MNKRYIIFLFALACLKLNGQIILNETMNGTSTYDYAAPEYIRMMPGFEYIPQSTNYFRAYIDPNAVLINPVTYVETPVDPKNRPINTAYEVGTTAGQASVSLTGGATYTVPIYAAPGTAGMQPAISLAYNSQSGNGIAGYGWSIEGLSCITRVPHTIYHDGAVKGVDYIDDNFALDGQRLIKIGNNGADSKYYTEVFDGAIVILHKNTSNEEPEWFEVNTKEGMRYVYGENINSQLRGNPTTGNIIEWKINKMTDANGNYIEFEYNNSSMQCFIKEIKYTGNTSFEPYNSIKFYYSERLDKSNRYVSGKKVENNVLLDHIDIETESTIIKTYKLKYYFNLYSKLNEVEEYGSDNTRFNSTAFGYDDATQHAEDLKSCYDFNIHQNFFADFNGDGRTDIFRYTNVSNIPGKGTWMLYTIKENGYFNVPPVLGQTLGQTGDTVHAFSIGDYNGDGYSDVQIFEVNNYNNNNTPMYEYQLHSLYSNGQMLVKDTIDLGPAYYKTQISSGDFDGDCKDEILLIQQLAAQTLRMRIYKITSANLVTGAFTKSVVFDKLMPLSFETLDSTDNYVLDFDNDGISEFLFYNHSSQLNEDLLSICEFKLVPTNSYNLIFTEAGSYSKRKTFPGDFNGDGNSDILDYKNNNWSLRISTGQNVETINLQSNIFNVNPFDTLAQVMVHDFNHDGKTDFAYSIYNPSTFYLDIHLLLSTGINFIENNWGYTLINEYTRLALNNRFIFKPREVCPVDFNGDGNGDYVFQALYSYGENYDFFYDRFYVSSLNPGFDPLFIKNICNGLNSICSFEYKSLTDASVYTKGSYTNTDCINIQPAELSVSAFNSEDGIGGIHSLNFQYYGALLNMIGKGFLGFTGITVTDPIQQNKEISTFNLDPNYYILIPSQKTIKDIEDNELINSQFTYSYQTITNAPNKVIFPYPHETNKYDYINNTRTKTTIGYDSFANLITQSDEIYPSIDASAQVELSNMVTYSDFVNGSAWCPSKPSNIVQTKLRNGEQSITTKKHFTYWPLGSLWTTIDYYEQDSAVQTTYPEYFAGMPLSSCIHVLNRSNFDGDITQQITYDDKYRFQLKVTDALGLTSSFTFDAGFGTKLTTQDANERITSYKYDGFGRNIEITDDDGVWIKSATNWFQDPLMENVLFNTQSTSNHSPSQTNFYDKLGRTLYTKSEYNDGSAAFIKKEFNEKGLLFSISEPYSVNSIPSQFTITQYDNYNRPKIITLPTQTQIVYTYPTYTYPTAVFPERTTIITRKNSINGTTISETERTNNASGLLVSSKDLGGTIFYSYYSDGQLKNVTTPDDNITLITYDAYGRQSHLNDPDAGTTTYIYNALGQLQNQTDARSVSYSMSYDKAGRLLKKAGSNTSDPQTTNCTYTYNPASALKGSRGLLAVIEFTDEAANSTIYNYFYDDNTRLHQKNISNSNRTFTYNYVYDNLGNLKEYSYPSSYTITFDYDVNNGALKKVLQKSDNKVIYEPCDYNARGQLEHYKIANGSIFTSLEFDDFGMPAFIKTGKNYAGADEIQNLETYFDIFTGNLSYRKDLNYTVNGNPLHETFTYDNDFKNYLQTWQVEGQIQYSMNVDNSNGNILSKSDFTSSGNDYHYSPDHPHALDQVIDPLMVPAEVEQYISYNLAGKVEEIEHSQQNKRLDICYNPLDERIKSILYDNNSESKTKYYIEGDFEVEIKQGGNERYLHFLPGGGLYISHNNPSIADSLDYILTDYQGSWYKVIDYNGNTIDHYSFDPWGRRRNPTDWTYNNIPTALNFDRGYTGHEMLDAFGLINMNGRVYDPIVARFLSPDNYVQNPTFSHSYNRYSYCFNNPLKYTDPSGYLSWAQMQCRNYAWGYSYTNIDGMFVNTYTLEASISDIVHNNKNRIGLYGLYNSERYGGGGGGYAPTTSSESRTNLFAGGQGGSRVYFSTSVPIYTQIDPDYNYLIGWFDEALSWASGYECLSYLSGISAEVSPTGEGGGWMQKANGIFGVTTTMITAGTECANAYVRNQFKSATSWTGWTNLRATQQTWRTVNVLSKTGAATIKIIGTAGGILGGLSASYSTYKVANQYLDGGVANVNGWDVADAAVGWAGTASAAVLLLGTTNPVGWAVLGIGAACYGAFRAGQYIYENY